MGEFARFNTGKNVVQFRRATKGEVVAGTAKGASIRASGCKALQQPYYEQSELTDKSVRWQRV